MSTYYIFKIGESVCHVSVTFTACLRDRCRPVDTCHGDRGFPIAEHVGWPRQRLGQEEYVWEGQWLQSRASVLFGFKLMLANIIYGINYRFIMPIVHTADMDKTRLFCPVRVGGVNRIGDKSRQFSVVLNIFETEQF